ncbi:hypothetical protein WR25_20923 [Diploscapter pachys]|uniref:Uncharacterized protein n=1 Tax=Diploscapter pachys TaxID=2018661 RepID=A0A2A2KAI2_9BILA|nr:hypothetical protein WR25_20923 [Diploscapter pachys]
MNVTDEKFARPVLYIYFMHGFTIFFGLPLHLVMFYAVITKTPLCKNPSSFATEVFFTSLSTPVLFLPIPAGQAEGILEMVGIRYISSLDEFHNQVTLVPAIYSE